MRDDNYCIRPDYIVNNHVISNDKNIESNYWDKSRIRKSEYYQHAVYSLVSRIIGESRAKSIIDVGCGIGVKLKNLKVSHPEVEIFGVDQHDPIAYCKNTYSFGAWMIDDFDDNTLDLDKRFDIVVCSDVIEHVENPDNLINYLKNKVSPEGYIVISTPDRNTLRGRNCVSSPNRYHVREWSFYEFENYIKSHDLDIFLHKLQYPVKFGLNKIFIDEIVKRLIRFKPLKYNQTIVCRLKA